MSDKPMNLTELNHEPLVEIQKDDKGTVIGIWINDELFWEVST